MDTTESRHYIDAELQAALELLEKAQAMVTIAWDDRSAPASLIYAEVLARRAMETANTAACKAQNLYREVMEEEKRAEGTERNPS